MSCKFSCSVKYSQIRNANEVVMIHASAGDEYTVKYKSNEHKDFLLTVQWTIPKDVFVTAELYSLSFSQFHYSTGGFASNKRVALKLSEVFTKWSSDTNVLCLISVIPYIGPNTVVSAEKAVTIEAPFNYVADGLPQLSVDERDTFMSGHIQDTVMSNFKKEIKGSNTVESNDVPAKSVNETELQELSMDSRDNTSSNVHDALITDAEMGVQKASPQSFSTKSVPSELQELSRDSQDVLLSDNAFDNAKPNTEIIEHNVVSNDDCTKSVPPAKRKLQKLSRNAHNVTLLDNVDHNKRSNTKHKVSSNDVATKNFTGIERELQVFSTDNHNFSRENDAIIIDKVIETQSKDVSAKSLLVKKSVSTDNHNITSENRNDIVNSTGNTKMKIKETPTCCDEPIESVEAVESELQEVSNHEHNLRTSHHVCNPVISKEACNTTSTFFSEKTEIISRTLGQALDADNYELTLTNKDDAVVSNTDVKKDESIVLNNVSEETFPVMEKDFFTLSMDMLKLLKSGKMADAVISNGNKEVKVHKIVLSARFPFLREKFASQTVQNMRHPVILDIPDDLLEDVVLFMYVGLVNIKNKKMAHGLYKIAEKYHYKTMIRVCTKHLLKLTVDNVLDTLVIVSDINNSIKVHVLNFILQNFSTLKNTEKISDFIKENPDLVLEILSYIIETASGKRTVLTDC